LTAQTNKPLDASGGRDSHHDRAGDLD
jgi:hypothetical protein